MGNTSKGKKKKKQFSKRNLKKRKKRNTGIGGLWPKRVIAEEVSVIRININSYSFVINKKDGMQEIERYDITISGS